MQETDGVNQCATPKRPKPITLAELALAGPAWEMYQPLEDALAELCRARYNHRPMHSAHEGYAVIREELDELWEEIKKRRECRSVERMRAEALQVAAMALRFAIDVCER